MPAGVMDTGIGGAPLRNKKQSLFGSNKLHKVLIPVLFLSIGVVSTFVLKYYVIFKAIQLSLYRFNIQSPPGLFVGFQNFIDLFHDPDYWQAWRNTFAYLGLNLVLTFLVPLIQALFLEEVVRFRSLASTIYILPAVIPGTINIVLWRWIWEPSYGLANFILSWFGIPAQTWLSSTHLVKFCLVFPGIVGGGIGVLIYLAAIYGISEDVKEAARLDGCVGIKRMFYITLPNIGFLVFINLVLSVIGSLQILDWIFQFTNGGPAGYSESVALFIYHDYMTKFNYGAGSAASLTLMVVIALLTFFQMRLNERQD